MLKWETVPEDTTANPAGVLITVRAKVPKGWLVVVFGATMPSYGGLTFVPDPGHNWKIEPVALPHV